MAVGIFTSMANDELTKAIAALRSEIAELREENAQLRVAPHRNDAAEPLATLRGLAGRFAAGPQHVDVSGSASPGDAAGGADDAWQAMTDVLVMRDVLLEMCAQIRSVADQMARRLERLGP